VGESGRKLKMCCPPLASNRGQVRIKCTNNIEVRERSEKTYR